MDNRIYFRSRFIDCPVNVPFRIGSAVIIYRFAVQSEFIISPSVTNSGLRDLLIK